MGSPDDVIDTEKFIQSVRRQTVLWDPSEDDYNDRTKRWEAWMEVCRQLYDGFDDFDIQTRNEIGRWFQKKWRNLRSCFTRDIRKRKDTGFRRKYVYFDDLSFLLPCSSEEATETTSSFNRDSWNPDLNDDDEEDTSSQNNIPGEPEKIEEQPPGKKPKLTEAEDKPYVQKLCEVLHKSVEQQTILDAQLADDEDKLFLLSLVKDLKGVPSHSKLQAKSEIMSVISKYKNYPFLVTSVNSNLHSVPNPNSQQAPNQAALLVKKLSQQTIKAQPT